MIKHRVLMTAVSGAFGGQNIDFMKKAIRNEKVWVLGVDIVHSYVAENKADKFELVPAGNSEDYINIISKLIKLHNISIVLPCSDEEAINLSKNKQKIESTGALLATADFPEINIMSNKISTYRLFKKLGIDVPDFQVINNKTELYEYTSIFYKERNSFVIKDAVARGNRGTILVDKDVDGIEEYKGSREIHIGWEYFNDNIIKEIGNIFPKLITERLYEPAFDIDILAKYGKVIHAIARERINPAGVPYHGNIMRNSPKLLDLAKKVSEGLKLSWLYDIDVMTRKDGTPIILEVNPRPSGSSVASMECGVPLYRDLLELFSSDSFQPYKYPKEGTIISPSLICNIIDPKII